MIPKLILISIAVALAYECKPSVAGKKYDFSPLQKPEDYVIPRASIGKGWDVLVNMCVAVSNKACPTTSAICQVWDYNCPTPGCGSASLGDSSSFQWLARDGEVVAKIGGGDGNRNSEIRFKCSTANNNPVFSNEDPTLEYNFAWETAHACATGSSGGGGGKMDGGWIFIIILVCGFSVYFIVGIIIKIAKFQASGSEIIPNRDFWCGLPGLVKDGIMFIVNKTCRRGSA